MKLRPFELGLVIVFGGLAVLALALLAGYKPSQSDEDLQLAAIGTVTIWGTLPQAGMNSLLFDLTEKNEAYRNVSYRYYHPSEFDSELLSALADGVGPDLMLISHEKLVEMRRRIQPVSYESFSVRDIRNMYLDGSQVFALSDGLYGYPIAVDPLMMYWNRDILATEGYLDAPKTWENLTNSMFTQLIERDFDRTIQRSVVAMGEYSNVRNAFGVISALFLQGGSEGVVENSKGDYSVELQSSVGGSGDPLLAAADFYSRFSRSSGVLYSWNRSFEEDRMQFVSEDLVLYFGYGSEGPKIEKINPNLNFDIAEIPQGAAASVRRTYAKFYALSLLKASGNKSGAIIVLSNFGGQEIAEQIALASSMVPAYRSSVAAGSNDTYGRITYKSASIALGWLNPDLPGAEVIFENMTKDINENRSKPQEAVIDASSRLTNEF